VHSEPGAGSTFWFELTLTAAAKVAAGTPQDQADLPIENIDGRILLVDDNDTNLLLGSMILESLGLEVVTATGGADAITAAREGQFDLILMDLSMPEVDGLEATRRIREFAEESALPILALTAYADTQEKSLCFVAGMNAYLTKPIVREELARALCQWLPESAKETPAPSSVRATPGDTKPEPDQSLVDQSVLLELEQQIGRANLTTVIDKVLTEAAERWEELVAAEAACDVATMQRHAHSLGSIFRSAGLIQAGDALAAIETTLRGGEELNAGWLRTLEPLKSASLLALSEELRAAE
jgi:CheY-like chemotaxis protein